MSKLILTEDDKTYLRECGYMDEDFDQIERASRVCIYTLSYNSHFGLKLLSLEEAVALLGRHLFLSGLGRSAFHWTAVREKNGHEVMFDSSKLFAEQ